MSDAGCQLVYVDGDEDVEAASEMSRGRVFSIGANSRSVRLPWQSSRLLIDVMLSRLGKKSAPD